MAKIKNTDALIEEYESPKLKRDSKGRILPGQQSLNPGGRPKDMRNAQAKLHKALKKVEKHKGKTFIEHYIREAYEDKTMAIALLKKIVPDLKAVEIDEESKNNLQIMIQSFKGKEDDSKTQKKKKV